MKKIFGWLWQDNALPRVMIALGVAAAVIIAGFSLLKFVPLLSIEVYTNAGKLEFMGAGLSDETPSVLNNQGRRIDGGFRFRVPLGCRTMSMKLSNCTDKLLVVNGMRLGNSTYSSAALQGTVPRGSLPPEIRDGALYFSGREVEFSLSASWFDDWKLYRVCLWAVMVLVAAGGSVGVWYLLRGWHGNEPQTAEGEPGIPVRFSPVYYLIAAAMIALALYGLGIYLAANLIYPRNSGDISFNATAAWRMAQGVEYVRALEGASTGPALTVPLSLLLRWFPLTNFLLSLYCFCYNILLLAIIVVLGRKLCQSGLRYCFFIAGLMMFAMLRYMFFPAAVALVELKGEAICALFIVISALLPSCCGNRKWIWFLAGLSVGLALASKSLGGVTVAGFWSAYLYLTVPVKLTPVQIRNAVTAALWWIGGLLLTILVDKGLMWYYAADWTTYLEQTARQQAFFTSKYGLQIDLWDMHFFGQNIQNNFKRAAGYFGIPVLVALLSIYGIAAINILRRKATQSNIVPLALLAAGLVNFVWMLVFPAQNWSLRFYMTGFIATSIGLLLYRYRGDRSGALAFGVVVLLWMFIPRYASLGEYLKIPSPPKIEILQEQYAAEQLMRFVFEHRKEYDFVAGVYLPYVPLAAGATYPFGATLSEGAAKRRLPGMQPALIDLKRQPVRMPEQWQKEIVYEDKYCEIAVLRAR